MDRKNGDATVLSDGVVYAFETGLKQTFTPLYVGSPPHVIPIAAGDSVLHQHITTDVVPIRNNHMVLDRVLLLRYGEKPCTSVGQRSILFPSTEMISPNKALPTGTPPREVMLASQNMFRLPAIAIAEVGFMDMTIVQAETLLRKPDGFIIQTEASFCKNEGIRLIRYDDVQGFAISRCSEIDELPSQDPWISPTEFLRWRLYSGREYDRLLAYRSGRRQRKEAGKTKESPEHER